MRSETSSLFTPYSTSLSHCYSVPASPLRVQDERTQGRLPDLLVALTGQLMVSSSLVFLEFYSSVARCNFRA